MAFKTDNQRTQAPIITIHTQTYDYATMDCTGPFYKKIATIPDYITLLWDEESCGIGYFCLTLPEHIYATSVFSMYNLVCREDTAGVMIITNITRQSKGGIDTVTVTGHSACQYMLSMRYINRRIANAAELTLQELYYTYAFGDGTAETSDVDYKSNFRTADILVPYDYTVSRQLLYAHRDDTWWDFTVDYLTNYNYLGIRSVLLNSRLTCQFYRYRDRAQNNSSGYTPVVFDTQNGSINNITYNTNIYGYIAGVYAYCKTDGLSDVRVDYTDPLWPLNNYFKWGVSETDYSTVFKVYPITGEMGSTFKEPQTSFIIEPIIKEGTEYDAFGKLVTYQYLDITATYELMCDTAKSKLNKPTQSYTFDLASFGYGHTYNIGDYINVNDRLRNTVVKLQITKAAETYNANGYQCRLTVGEPVKTLGSYIKTR